MSRGVIVLFSHFISSREPYMTVVGHVCRYV